MAESSTQSMTMAASPKAIMDAIADFDAYPEWTASIKSAEVLDTGADGRARRVRFTLDAGLIKDTYELDYQWAGDGLSVTWDLVSGQMQKAQHGSYLLRPSVGGAGESDATEVTYSLSVDLSIPLIGPLRRKAERTIMDTALKELRKRVEAG
jgi:ribosome-associated toxin RatA of RatAB toxin-antitoxin module